MAKAKYQFEDFLTTVKDEYKDFVTKIHNTLLQDTYKSKIQVTKSNGFQLSYHQPKIKTVAGRILTFFLCEDELMVRINVNPKMYKSDHIKMYIFITRQKFYILQVKSYHFCNNFPHLPICDHFLFTVPKGVSHLSTSSLMIF